MKRLFFSLTVIFALTLLSTAQETTHRRSHRTSSQPTETANQPFAPGCDSPTFPASDATPADSACDRPGSGGLEAAQNTAKNDFCASGDAQSMTFDDFKKLQTQVNNTKSINFGNKNSATRKKGPTTKRDPLEKMGEGNLVVINGFVLIARQEGAESVNCGKNVPNEADYHDIHISLVPSADETSECNGIVVEMSPHHRPAEWNAENVNKLAKAHAPVRVTGHLFFDSSHLPCVRGEAAAGNPKRFSLWEVHPIYQLEVCTGNCDGDGQWSSLSDWVKNNQ